MLAIVDKEGGELTRQKRRKVKGKKGIGKFAGLMIANKMALETWTRGKKCTFSLSTADLEKAHDIEDLSVNLIVESIPDLDSHQGESVNILLN